MIDNLYVFAIGGSGERIMYSFLMQLVAGMPIQANQIHPIFIDNDEESKSLIDCKNLLKSYSEITGKLGAHALYERAGLQAADYPSFCRTDIAEPKLLNQSGAHLRNLEAVITDGGGIQMPRENEIINDIIEEKELLFSLDDLNMPLNIGFVGHPNIGSVVLNAVSLQSDFESIYNQVGPNDAVIVLGSLFGGTGAAGIPLVIHRFEQKAQNNRPLLGAVSLLPYFVTEQLNTVEVILDPTRYNVESDSFDAKTRAALLYYESRVKGLNYQYYVGCEDKASYEHCIGGDQQANPIHLVEVMAALSIFDFAKQSRTTNVVYKHPVWKLDNNQESNFSGITCQDLATAIAKFQIMKVMFENHNFIQDYIQQHRKYVENIGYTETERVNLVQGKEDYVAGLYDLFNKWDNWLSQLANAQKVKLKIFNNTTQINNEVDLLKAFYTESGWGICSTRVKKQWLREDKVEPVNPGIADAMLEAYIDMFPTGSTSTKFDRTKSLATLLQIISKALDKVLSSNCTY